MVCPICHKYKATKAVTRKLGRLYVTGEVCEGCVSRADNLSSEEFYNIFFKDSNKQCPHCKRTLYEIEETLIVGCENCYEVFKSELLPIIQRLQGKN